MDVKKQEKVDEQDFCASLTKYPDLLEIFDLLSKQGPEPVNVHDRTRELQIAKDISFIEIFLENVNSYLIGETSILQDISLFNQELAQQKMDFSYYKLSSFHEMQKKIHNFSVQNEQKNNDRDKYDESMTLNIDKRIDFSNKLNKLNTLQYQQSYKQPSDRTSKILNQDMYNVDLKNVQQSKLDFNKKKITHSMSVDIKNKVIENIHQNEKYLMTDYDQQQQNSNYKSNVSEYGSAEPKKLFDDNFLNVEYIEKDEKKQNQLEIKEEIANINSNNHLQAPQSPLNVHLKSQDSNLSQNATFQPIVRASPNNTIFGMIPQGNQNRINQRSNSGLNNDTINNNRLLLPQSPSLAESHFNNRLSQGNSNVHQRGYSSHSNSNEVDTAQFQTSLHTQQQQWLQNMQQSKQPPDYIMEGSFQNQNYSETMNATFQNKNFNQMNISASIIPENNKVGTSFQTHLKGNNENEAQIEKRRSSAFQNGLKIDKPVSLFSQLQPYTQGSLISPLLQHQSTPVLQPFSPISSSLNQIEEEVILKKYESHMCQDCISKVTQKYKQDLLKEQKRLSTIFHQSRMQSQPQQSQNLISQNISQNLSQNLSQNMIAQTPSSRKQNQQLKQFSKSNSGFSQQNLQPYINDYNFYLDHPNQTMKTKLDRFAEKILGDLDEIESCCLASDDDEQKKKVNQASPPPLNLNAFQYSYNMSNPTVKKGDSGLVLSGISTKEPMRQQSGNLNSKFSQNHRQYSSSSNVNDLNMYDSQVKSGIKDVENNNNIYIQDFNKQNNDEITNRIIKFDDQTDHSRLNSPEYVFSPSASNLISFYDNLGNFTGKTDGRNSKQPSAVSIFNQNKQNAVQNSEKVNSVQGYPLKYPNSFNKLFSKSNTIEMNRQSSASVGNATDVNQQFSIKQKHTQNNPISPHQPDDTPYLITDDIEIEISGNAKKVGHKFITSELSIKENTPSNNGGNFELERYKTGTFNHLYENTQIDPTQTVYVGQYKTNSKNTPSNSVQIKNLSNTSLISHSNSNQNRRIINVSNMKSNRESDMNNQQLSFNQNTSQSGTLLNKLEFDQMTNSLSHDLNSRLQFGNKNANEKSQHNKYLIKNIDSTGNGNSISNGLYQEVDEQEDCSSENLLSKQNNNNNSSNQKTGHFKKSQYLDQNDQSSKQDVNKQKLNNLLKNVSGQSQNSSIEKASNIQINYNNNSNNINNIQQNEKMQQTTSPTYKGSSQYYTHNQDSHTYDIQVNKLKEDQIDYLNTQSIFMKSNNVYGQKNMLLKSQNLQQSGKNNQQSEYIKTRSSILSPTRNNSKTFYQAAINSNTQDKSPNSIQFAIEMGPDEIRKRYLSIFSYIQQIQYFVQLIRRNIEQNINAKISDKLTNFTFGRKRSQENKNQRNASPINKQIQQINQSNLGKFQTSQSNQLNQSGINRTPPLHPIFSEDENIRISTISNIQKKQPKQKEPRKPKLMVFFGHQNWNLVVNMMMGISMSVQSAASNLTNYENNTYPELQNRDFKVKYLFELLPRKDNFEKEWSYKVCKFQDYAPNVFQRIRKFYNIGDEQYLKSLGPNQLFNLSNGGLNSFSQLTSTGKSGSFFYYTADGQFTLKTVSRSEFHHLKFILKNYYEHVKENRSTLIIKFFGLHKIKIRMKQSTKVEIVYIVIMSNVFHTTKLINERYDLKGSTYGRTTKVRTQGVTMKDLDFLNNKQKIQVKYDEYDEFMSIVRKDAQFFEQNNIIDYSMLVGIHYNSPQNPEQSDQISYTIRGDHFSRIYQNNNREKVRDISNFNSRDNKFTYLFGIIDILTCFNAKKKFEYVAKRIAFGPTISAIPPSQYSSRFVQFMDEMFDDDSKIPSHIR